MCNIGTAHTGHQFATAITPTGSSHLWSEARTGSCQQAVTGEQAPCIGNGVIGEHILAETVPFGGMAQIKAVLTALYGAEEDIEIHTAEEEHMTITGSSRCTAHNGLTTEFATIFGINPHRRWRGTFPCIGTPFLQLCNRHIHTVCMHNGRLTDGINLWLVSAKDKQGIVRGRTLNRNTWLKTTGIGQSGSYHPVFRIAWPA